MMRTLPILLTFLGGVVGADELILSDGGRLTGQVVSMGSEGTLSIRAGVATNPIEVLPNFVRSVTFSGTTSKPGDHDARLSLTNGDVLPCDLLKVGEDTVSVSTDFAGDLEISRNAVSQIQLGIRPRSLLHTGPGKASDWEISDEWAIHDGGLVANGRGSAGRSFGALPESFAVNFVLKWTDTPNFKFYFCSDSEMAGGGKHDRYYLQFGSAGFELKRQSSGKTSYHTLGIVNRAPSDFEKSEVAIELRVDRSANRILLYLDGELEGRYADPLDSAPEGDSIAFLGANSGENSFRVSRIEIREWDSTGDRHQSEERGNQAMDAMIDHEGQRFGGSLIGSTKKKEGIVFLFKSPHHPEPLEIPADRVSTMFFAEPKKLPNESALVFGLTGTGILSASECVFDADSMKLQHPLLGKITLARSAVVSLERREQKKEESE